jgi:hypothetical protein
MLEIVWILRLDCYDIRINLDLEDPWVITDCGAQRRDRLAQFGLVVEEARLGTRARKHQDHTDECQASSVTDRAFLTHLLQYIKPFLIFT